jgi:hypothetical protein
MTMGIGKRELIIVGVLLAVLTPWVLWQWRFSPDAYWQRAEFRRKTLEKEIARVARDKSKKVNPAALVRAMLPGYEEFLRRFPRHPKAAAARVIIAGLLERLDRRDPRILQVRAGSAAFYGNKQAAAEVGKLLTDPNYRDIAAEVLACLTPRRFARGQPTDTLTVESTAGGKTESIAALDSLSGKKVDLPLPASQGLVDGAQAWRHDLGRVAFATAPPAQMMEYPLHYGTRWMVWIADLKAGQLRAFLPSQPMPDLTKTEDALLTWSPGGTQLKCGNEALAMSERVLPTPTAWKGWPRDERP